MIYFDDELPPIVKPPRTRAHRWLRRILIALAVVAIFVWIGLRVLVNIGGHSPALRTGVENYLRSATGYQTHIGTFNSLTFYPALALDIGNVEFSAPASHPGPPVATIGGLKIGMGFWDMMFSRGRLRTLEITRLDFGRTLPLARPVVIDRAILEKTSGTDAALRVTGHYGADAFTARQTMLWQPPPANSGGADFFTRPDAAPFAFKLPFLTAHGIFAASKKGSAHFTFDEIGTPEKILTGDLTLSRSSRGTEIKGQFAGGRSTLDFAYLPGKKPMFDMSHIQATDLPKFHWLAAALRQIYPPALADLPPSLQ